MHSCWGQLGVLPTLRRAGPGLLLPMAFPIEKGKSIPGSVSTVMGGGELLFSNRLENKLLKKSFEGKKKKRKSKKTQPNPQLLRLMFPPVRARSTPMPISRYPQSCPLEIAHLGAPHHPHPEERFPGAWVACSFFYGKPNFAQFLLSAMVPTVRQGPRGGWQVFVPRPLVATCHHAPAWCQQHSLPWCVKHQISQLQ